MPSIEKHNGEWIATVIKEFINNSPKNTLRNPENEKAWAQPLVGFSTGNDPLYDFYKKDDVSAGLVVGVGDGAYLMDSEDLNVVNMGLIASSGSMSVSYILNPQAETNFIVFGYSF